MEPLAKIRFIVAAIVSPSIMPIMVYATFAFMLGGEAGEDQQIQTGISAAVWSSYISAFALGGVAYYFLRRKGWWSVWRFLLMGIVSGFACWLLFSLASQIFVSILFYVFIISGAIMGTEFWLIAFFRPDGNHLTGKPISPRRRRRRKS